jgi:hypothetical protein
MKYQTRQTSMPDRRLARNQQVRKEIQSFLLALRSYPDSFAKNPSITFEMHHGGLVRAATATPRRRP